jgi:phosphoribosyl-ATP pyrophosphohydrolase
MLDRIKKLAQINGMQVVREKAQEEAQELIDAIDENIKSHVSTEMADNLIMIFQLMVVYDNEDEVYDQLDFKVKRQEKRFAKEKIK